MKKKETTRWPSNEVSIKGILAKNYKWTTVQDLFINRQIQRIITMLSKIIYKVHAYMFVYKIESCFHKGKLGHCWHGLGKRGAQWLGDHLLSK